MYIISFYGKRYSKKPVSVEIAEINNKLSEKRMTYIDMANEIGENGCSFAPAVFNGRRKQDNFKEQQLIALDFDDGTTFDSIRLKAEKYGLSILFAYKTFSWKANKEKFRVVFAMGEAMKSIFIAKSVILIFMRIFTECDLACKDVSRMFFGGKGLLYVAEIEYRISMEILLTGFSMFMADTYGERHYKEKIREFYSKNNIKIALNTENSATQGLEQGGKCTLPIINNSKCANSPKVQQELS